MAEGVSFKKRKKDRLAEYTDDEILDNFIVTDLQKFKQDGMPYPHRTVYCRHCVSQFGHAGMSKRRGFSSDMRNGLELILRTRRDCAAHLLRCRVYDKILREELLGTKPVASSKKRPAAESLPEVELYDHFVPTGLKRFKANGEAYPHKTVYCVYCKQHYEREMKLFESQQTETPPEPLDLVLRSGRECRAHLKKCIHFKERDQLGFDSSLSFPINDSASSSEPFSFPETEGENMETASLSNLIAPALSTLKKQAKPRKKTISNRQPQSQTKANSKLETALKPDMEEKACEFLVAVGLPLEVAGGESFRRLVQTCASTGIPPFSVEKLRHTIIPALAISAVGRQQDRMTKLEKQGFSCAWLIESWINRQQQRVLSIRQKLGEEDFQTIEAQSIAQHHDMALARCIEDVMKVASPKPRSMLLPFKRARRILALRHPRILFTECWSNQIKGMAQVVWKNAAFQKTLQQATRSVLDLRKSAEWWALFRDSVSRIYGSDASPWLFSVGGGQWTSCQACFASLLRLQTACKYFADEHAGSSEYPKGCLTWENETFWNGLRQAEIALRPLCDASFLLQTNRQVTLAHGLLVVLNLYRSSKAPEYPPDMALEFRAALERRWKRLEHPLYFLAFALHPDFRLCASAMLTASTKDRGSWNRDRNPLTVLRLLTAAKFYYQKHCLWVDSTVKSDKELRGLAKDLGQWLRGETLDGLECEVIENGENVAGWWLRNSMEYPELAAFASFLLGVPVQSAENIGACSSIPSVEDTKSRLCTETLHQHRVIRHDLHRKYKLMGGNNLLLRVKSATELEKVEPSVAALEATGVKDEASMLPELSKRNVDKTEDGLYDEADLQEVSDLMDGPSADSSDDAFVAADDVRRDGQAEGDEDEEDPFEVAGGQLSELPTTDDPNYPEEDADYFSQKRYVRNDKHSLEEISGFDLGSSELRSNESSSLSQVTAGPPAQKVVLKTEIYSV